MRIIFRTPSSTAFGRARYLDNNDERVDLRGGRKGDQGRATRSALAIDRLIDRGLSERKRLGGRVAQRKKDGEAQGVFGPELLPSEDEGRSGRKGGREHLPASSGQAPEGGVGEDIRRSRRERPLSSGSELQVLSSEAEGAGGAEQAERARERGASSCFDDFAPFGSWWGKASLS